MDKNAKVTGIDNGVGQFAAEASVEVDDLVPPYLISLLIRRNSVSF